MGRVLGLTRHSLAVGPKPPLDGALELQGQPGPGTLCNQKVSGSTN